ncbi:hypothetical protein ACWEFJ_28280 [Actinosynnema sp. NPDC004786]
MTKRAPKTLRGFRTRAAEVNRALVAVGDLPSATPEERLAYLRARRDVMAAFVQLYSDACAVVPTASVEWDALYDARSYREDQLRDLESEIALLTADAVERAAGGVE